MKGVMNKKSGIILAAAVAALAGMVIYIITSVTGYLAVSAVNPWPVVCTVLAVLMLGVIVFPGKGIAETVKDVLLLAASALLLAGLYFFVLGRVQLAADVYFIPVNYPASEAAALHISIGGVVLYLIADIAMIAAAFTRAAEKE